MKRFNNIGFALCLILAITFAIGSVANAAGPAPLYTGPTVQGEQTSELIAGEGDDYTLVWDVYYTKDTKDKVVAFYEANMAKKSSYDFETTMFTGPDGSPLKYQAVMVRIPDNGIDEGDLFDPLRKEVSKDQGGVGHGGRTQADLKAAMARYGYLAEEAFFPDFSAADKLAACKEKVESGETGAAEDSLALQNKLQELAMQGRFAEMQQYMGQAQDMTSNMQQAVGASQWDGWIGCLDELVEGAYRVQIEIRVK